MTRFTPTVAVWTLTCTFLGGTLASAQVRMDVKTRIDEKQVLSVAKAGVISFLRNSPWAVVAELKEDYALWLRNQRRQVNGRRVTVELDVEVRKPRLAGLGALVAGRRVTVDVDLEAMSATFSPAERQAVLDLESSRALQAIAMAITGTVGAKVLTSNGGNEAAVRKAIDVAGRDLGKAPTPDEALECLLIGGAVYDALMHMRAQGAF